MMANKEYEIYPALMQDLDQALIDGFDLSDSLYAEFHWCFRNAIELYAKKGCPFVKEKKKGGGQAAIEVNDGKDA